MTATPAPLSAQTRTAALAALADAHAYYRSRVDRSWVPDYLSRRHLSSQIVPARLGYAPGGWTTLRDHLRRQGYSDTTLETAGLVRRTRTGGLVDLFRDRLMIPLRTCDGVLVGFSGRAAPIADATTPKYLNSPASELFVKHDLLHGLAEDADALHAGALPVLVEGPLDRLAVAHAVHPLVAVAVSPSGTALSAHQAAALLGVVGPHRPIAVMLDADPPGRAATRHAWENLTDTGATHLRHIALPDGHDPADLIRDGHNNLLRDAIRRHTPLAHAVADHTLTTARALTAARDTSHPAGAGTAGTAGTARTASTDDWQRDWQRALQVARQLLHDDLRRVPHDQIAAYITHIANRLQLPTDIVTAAAAETITSSTPYTSDPERHRRRDPARPSVEAHVRELASDSRARPRTG